MRIRSLDSIKTQALPATAGSQFPFWSPDSRFLGFFAGGKLKKIDVNGGPPLTLCDFGISPFPSGTWGKDVIVFRDRTGIKMVSAAGGVPSLLLTPDAERGEFTLYFPQFLPDDRRFLYVTSGKARDSIGVRSTTRIRNKERGCFRA